jgi:hypothetical protein
MLHSSVLGLLDLVLEVNARVVLGTLIVLLRDDEIR